MSAKRQLSCSLLALAALCQLTLMESAWLHTVCSSAVCHTISSWVMCHSSPILSTHLCCNQACNLKCSFGHCCQDPTPVASCGLTFLDAAEAGCLLGCTHAAPLQVSSSIMSACPQLQSTVGHCCLRCNLSALQFVSPAVVHQLTCSMSCVILYFVSQSVCIHVAA